MCCLHRLLRGDSFECVLPGAYYYLLWLETLFSNQAFNCFLLWLLAISNHKHSQIALFVLHNLPGLEEWLGDMVMKVFVGFLLVGGESEVLADEVIELVLELLLTFLVLPEGLKPLELVLVDHCPLLGLLIRLLYLSELFHELKGFFLLLLELLSDVLAPSA